MNVERLKIVSTMLRNLKPENDFDLYEFAGFSVGDKFTSYREDLSSSEQEACGTCACACGYAALHPDLRAQGLTMSADTEDGSVPVEDVFAFNEAAKDRGVSSFFFEFKDGDQVFRSRSAFQQFFDIDSYTFNSLFLAEEGYGADVEPATKTHVSAVDVADKIDETIAEYEATQSAKEID